MTAAAIPRASSQALPLAHFFGEVTSTFDVAFDLFSEGRLREWDSVLAKSQTQGRGQLRRHWDSPPGNMYATIRLPHTPPFDTHVASIAIGAFCANALRSFGCPVQLKWPNDLVVEKDGEPAKLGGILLEERNGCLLAGIGVNITHAPTLAEMREESAMPAADLACGGKEKLPTPTQLWLSLVRHIHSVYKSGSFFPLIWKELAEEMLLWKNSPVEMLEGAKHVSGILRGIGKNGGALLEQGGETREIIGGGMWPAAKAGDPAYPAKSLDLRKADGQ